MRKKRNFTRSKRLLNSRPIVQPERRAKRMITKKDANVLVSETTIETAEIESNAEFTATPTSGQRQRFPLPDRAACLLLTFALLVLPALPQERQQAPPELVPQPVQKPAPAVQIIPPPAQPASVPAHVIDECTITCYDVCALCCGKTDGITASGANAVPYETCAVDPALIPLGSSVLVDFGDGVLHPFRAEDTGGSVKGRHIDLCVAAHQEALELGVRQATVYWAPPEELDRPEAGNGGTA